MKSRTTETATAALVDAAEKNGVKRLKLREYWWSGFGECWMVLLGTAVPGLSEGNGCGALGFIGVVAEMVRLLWVSVGCQVRGD